MKIKQYSILRRNGKIKITGYPVEIFPYDFVFFVISPPSHSNHEGSFIIPRCSLRLESCAERIEMYDTEIICEQEDFNWQQFKESKIPIKLTTIRDIKHWKLYNPPMRRT